MKYFFAIIIVLASIAHADAQVAFGAKKVIFLGKQIQVPDSCIAETDFQVNCEGSYYVAWLEITPIMITDIRESFVGEAERKKNANKKKIKCEVEGKKVDAWLVKYNNDNGQPESQIIATGKVKGKDLLIHIVIFKHVASNADIPGIAAEIIQIVE